MRGEYYLGQGVGRVDDELLGLVVVGGGGLHLHGVVAVPELGQAEAADVIEIVDTLKKTVIQSCNAINPKTYLLRELCDAALCRA